MGAAARIITAVVTGGGSELARAAGQATGIDQDLLNPVGAATSKGLAAVGVRDKSSNAVVASAPIKPGMTDAEREREARLARERRRREYQDLGRSSTILTGPGGLLGQGAGEQKTLLGS